ncbi:hypothetical protein ACFLT0_01875 [Chloroflexota bacterium]
MEKARECILNLQQSWAIRHDIYFDKKGYVRKLADNLYEPLKKDSLDEFIRGRGAELESKMLALHSSSALVVNFFQYWRYHDIPQLAVSMGLSAQCTHLKFERTYPKPAGVKGIRPYVDVEFTGASKPTAVESKFTEPYSKGRKSLGQVYIETSGVWGKYTSCKLLASQILSGEKVFEHLDAPQLIKHILGLKTKYGEESFTLLYLWYDFASAEADKHRQEMQTFKKSIEDEVDFRHLTYQDLFKVVSSIPGVDNDYVSYLHDRYFQMET